MHAAQTSEPVPMTEEAYLEFEAASDTKHEFSRSYVRAMTGGSVCHGVITVNISTQFNLQWAERDCAVLSPDTRVHIAGMQSYRYPDVTVFCGAPAYVPGRVDTITNPVVLVEVLSPSTALLDRNEKLAEYTSILSLQMYLLVSQDQIKVETFMRHSAGQWIYQNLNNLDDHLHVPSPDCTLALSKIYHKVNWETEP
jgi:Uma2 family endonuclease